VAGDTHEPVLPEEAIRYLGCRPGARVVDCTAGGGGHARRILDRIGPGGRLLALDRDPEAVERGRRELPPESHPISWLRSDFRRIAEIAVECGWDRIDAVLADLGLSGLQLADPSRGFSFQTDGPLDMRFDRSGGVTAEWIVNHTPEDELRRILVEFGEEPQAGRVARRIVRERDREPIRTTRRLAAILEELAGARRRRIHPATRVFQALRIAVNRELEGLDRFVESAAGLLAPGGRIVIITFHSLEDRIVKRSLAAMARHCVCPPRLPQCACGEPGILRVLTRRVVRPGTAEQQRNPRSRSARLRAAERLPAAPVATAD
jgi:16S rRNA (cytosine1402-N4)-methyltransferase